MIEPRTPRFIRSRNLVRWMIAATLVALSLVVSSGLAQETIVEQGGRLRAADGLIVDGNGQPIVLRGVSLGGSPEADRFCTPGVVRWLADDWMCTLVRVAVTVGPEGSPPSADREKQKVHAVVQTAIERGIYVLIAWQDAYANRNAAQAQAFFAEMAETYGEHPNVMYEPWSGPSETCDWDTVIKPYFEAMVPQIREHAGDGMIVCGTENQCRDINRAAQNPLAFDDIAYSLHFRAGTHTDPIRDTAAAALQEGIALMVTQWTASDGHIDDEVVDKETQRWFDFMDEHRVSWCNQIIADTSPASSSLLDGADVAGGWSLDVISPIGRSVRTELRIENQLALMGLREIRRPDILYVPTPQRVVDKMLEMAQVTKDDLVYDLGCGDARIVVTAAQRYGCRAVGYDIDPQRVRDSVENVERNNVGHLVRIEQKDVFTLDLSDANVITLYLLPSLNVKLIPQLEKLRDGSRIVSHDFDMRGVTPDEVVRIEEEQGIGGHSVYFWTTPLKREPPDSDQQD